MSFDLGLFVETWTGSVLQFSEVDGGKHYGPLLVIDEKGAEYERFKLTKEDAQKLVTFLQGWIATAGGAR